MQEEYHEFIRERSQKKFASTKAEIKIPLQNVPYRSNNIHFQKASFNHNKPQQFQQPVKRFSLMSKKFNPFMQNAPQPKPFFNNTGKPQSFGKPKQSQEPMSVQFRVPTKQFQNQFENPTTISTTTTFSIPATFSTSVHGSRINKYRTCRFKKREHIPIIL